MKAVPVFRHVPHETLGLVETALTSAGLVPQYVDLFEGLPRRPELGAATGLVVLGGPMNVDETDKYPFLAKEVEWIQDALARGLPVLGICLGAQLLAKSLGARVFPNGTKEIGFYPLEFTPQAARDALFGDIGNQDANTAFPRRMTVFQWHGDTFELPRGAVHLAQSEACRHQAFRYGDSAYALQFHIEVTAEMIEDWLSEAGNCGELAELDYIDPRAIRAQVAAELPTMHAWGARVFARFAATCSRERSS